MTGPSGRPIVDVLEEGLDLYSSDGEKIGHVEEINPDFFLVKKGLFRSDLYIPRTAEERAEGNNIYLNLTKDELESGDYDQPPQGMDTSREQYEASDEMTYDRDRAVGGDTERVQRHEEELQAQKTARQTGEVSIGKEVVEEEQTLEVPVTREEVQVTSRPVDRPGEVGDAAFQGESVTVPVVEEEVQVTKQPRVVEELEVQKVARQDTEQVSDTVRKERLDVDDSGQR